MNDSNTTSDDRNNHNNWLGFSLSPHMNMEVSSSAPQHHHHHYHHTQEAQQASAAAAAAAATVSNTTIPTTFYLSPSHIGNSGICYGVGENGNLIHSPLTVMPLKSDGSLCIMEALGRSQSQGWFEMCLFFFFIFL